MKSYKREVALGSLIFLYALIAYAVYVFANGGHIQAIVDILSILVIPTFGTVAAAFGIDAFFKQNPRLKESQSNTQSNIDSAVSGSELDK
jgi:hypothetical protein